MNIKINRPDITRKSFEDMWLSYTSSRIWSIKWWAIREINTNKFNIDFNVSDETPHKDIRYQRVLSFSYCRLFERLGYNNNKIRNLSEFRRHYLSEIKNCWRDYYNGIRGNSLPYRSHHDIDKQILDIITRNAKLVFRRSCQTFFIKWRTKKIHKLVKPNFKSVCIFIENDDFDGFEKELRTLLTSRRYARILRSSTFNPTLDFMMDE